MSDRIDDRTAPATKSVRPPPAKPWASAIHGGEQQAAHLRDKGGSRSERVEWTADFYRVRGWKSNTARNEALKSDLDARAARLLQPQGPDGFASLKAENLKPGDEFNSYLQALRKYEESPGQSAASALKSAGEAYINHYAGHSDTVKKQTKTQRKYQTCQKTLADLALLTKIQGIPSPPWNSTQAMQAATVKAEADFSSLPLGEQKVESLDGKGVNPTFWVNKAGSDPNKLEKSYLFKPITTNQDRKGIPQGGEPAREALTSRAADVLQGMTGIDFKVPETHIVSVERQRFDGVKLSDEVMDDKTGPLVGSLQQFAPSKGELRENSSMLARAVPAERCQAMAILDIVTLNVDRHGGNFMIDGNDKAADLVPIDNGLSFPGTPDDLSRMSTSHNALLRLPGSHKPFTKEMLEKISRINPDTLNAALKSEVSDIEKVHASAQGKVADSALEQSRRSTMFLKLAAPTLTPAAVQVALGQNAALLFEPGLEDTAFTNLARKIIASMQVQQSDLADFFQMTMDEYLRLKSECEQLGWEVLDLSPQQALKVFKAGTPRQAPAAAPANTAALTEKEIAEFQQVFPGLQPSGHSAAWRTLSAMGNGNVQAIKAAVTAAAAKMNDPTYSQKVLKDPENLVKVLQVQSAADALPPGGSRRLMDAKRDLIKELATILPDDKKTQVCDEAYLLHSADQKDNLDKLRDGVIVAARDILLAEIETLRQKAPGIQDPDDRTRLLKSLATEQSAIREEAMLVERKANIDKLKQRYLNF
jgi:hypothetical protein